MKRLGLVLVLSAWIFGLWSSTADAAEAKIGIRVRLISRDSDEDEFVDYWTMRDAKTAAQTSVVDLEDETPKQTPSNYLYDKQGRIVATIASIYGEEHR